MSADRYVTGTAEFISVAATRLFFMRQDQQRAVINLIRGDVEDAGGSGIDGRFLDAAADAIAAELADTPLRIVYPEARWISRQEVVSAALDAFDNHEIERPPATVEEAVSSLGDVGNYTFAAIAPEEMNYAPLQLDDPGDCVPFGDLRREIVDLLGEVRRNSDTEPDIADRARDLLQKIGLSP